jgi:SIR2-like domain
MTPTRGVDPRDALATSLHASPGVYAVLVGSGMSTAAGIKTTWGVVQDLIRRVATSEGVDPKEFDEAPEDWWAAQGRPELRYDLLLEELASTDTARRALLRRYFDPLPENNGPVVPTLAHYALAQLCATGRVNLILTTNFDGLIERALEAAGLSPQVISSPGSIRGMTPVQHAGVTLLKLHGDYASPGLKNTSLELGSYSPALKRLLARVFDEYGLIVVGWSGEYDLALVKSLEQASSRRYPTYWATFQGSVTGAAKQLIAQRQAHVTDTAGADEFLTDLVERVGRLDRIAARRRGPQPIHNYYLAPDFGGVPQGWGALPLLVLRAVATMTTATGDNVGLIGPSQRRRLVAALNAAPITNRMRSQAVWPAALASGEPPPNDVPPNAPPLTQWVPPVGANQSTAQARYRLGGDGSVGTTALVDVRMPRTGVGGGATFILDMGISLGVKLHLNNVAELFRDGLVTVTSILPDALADMLPNDALVDHCEIHLLASSSDGQGKNRPNSLEERVDLELFKSFDAPNPQVGPQLGFAAKLGDPLTTRDAAELVAYGLNYMALAIGFLDPSRAITPIRTTLSLPAEEQD